MSDCAAKRFAEEFQILSSQSDLGLPIELIKARVSERLMLEVSNACPSVGKTHQFSSKMWSITHDVYKGVECKDVDPVGRPFESSMMQKNVNLYAANTVVSERFSFHKFSDISANSHKKDLKVNMSTSNALAFSPKEYQLHSHRMVDENMSKCRSTGRSCGNMGSSLLGAHEHFATETDALYSGTLHASAFASTSTDKDSGCQNPRIAEQIATSSIRGVSSGIGRNETLSVTAANHKSCLKETFTDKQEWSMSKTSSMNLDLILFQISRMKNPISSTLIESPVCSEPSNKWLKRLQHDALDPHLPCSKRSKVGDGLKPGLACAVFGQELNFDMGKADMIKQAKEVQLRWCQGGTPISHGASNIEKQSPKFNVPPDDLEGQFPSIAAMAMMGRTMNKLRPCELQKRGPSVVWKTQGL
ncbi:hypothetical protein HU200_036944 [Digitaria exilis]|uniref:Uncharacterized protein n=1 Tax=Digitaria exilis TaxID=1010633 RepID=A0A835BMF7_9POAL|nr:hypothetical protein HU200_036944 [Digitaria exilis]